MDNKKIGRFIREIRKEKNMTQKDLAEKLYLTDKAISKWERGLSFPDITMLNTLSETLDVEVSEILNGERGKKEEKDIEKAVEEALEQINKTKEKREKKILKIKKIVGIVSVIIFALFFILQIGYICVLKINNFEYIADYLFYIVNEIIIASATLGLVFIVKKNSKIKNYIVYVICTLLTIINIVFMMHNGFDRQCIVDFSSTFSNVVILKRNKETGETTLYKNYFLLFAKQREQFSYPVNSKIIRNWLTDDICLINYQDSNKKIRAYVATYGDRGNGNYYNVAPAISGDWQTFSQYGNLIKIIVDSKGITIKKDGNTELFEYINIKQFGTTAIVLYEEEKPKYVIALNQDCKIESSKGIVNQGGTITFSEVSMDKVVSRYLKCIIYKGNLDNYKTVSVDPYSYTIKNGILYIRYDDDNIIEVPGEFSGMENVYNKFNYQIADEKTVFFYKTDEKIKLVYSDDKGVNWNTVELQDNASIQNIHFINSNLGYMLEFKDVAMSSAWGVLRKTIDGGKTWQAIDCKFDSDEKNIFRTSSQIRFFNENLGFVTMPLSGGMQCELYITKDSCKTFEKLKVPEGKLDENVMNPANLSWNDIYDTYNLPTIKDGILYLEVGQGADGDYNGGDTKLYISNDDGKTWSLKETSN